MTYKDSFAYGRGYDDGKHNGIIEGREQTTICLLSKFKKVLDEEIIAFAEKTNYTPYQITAMIDAEAMKGDDQND